MANWRRWKGKEKGENLDVMQSKKRVVVWRLPFPIPHKKISKYSRRLSFFSPNKNIIIIKIESALGLFQCLLSTLPFSVDKVNGLICSYKVQFTSAVPSMSKFAQYNEWDGGKEKRKKRKKKAESCNVFLWKLTLIVVARTVVPCVAFRLKSPWHVVETSNTIPTQVFFFFPRLFHFQIRMNGHSV